MASRLLTSVGVEFEEVDVSGDLERRRWLARVSGQHTVPQIFVGETAIGGYSELRALLSGGVSALFAEASEERRAGVQPEED